MAGEAAQHYNVLVDTEDSFGVRNASPSWSDVLAFDLDDNFESEALEDQTARSNRGANAAIAGSKSTSQFSFSTYFSGLTTAPGDNVTATQTALGKILKAAIGTEHLGTTGVVDTGGGLTTAVTLGSGDGAGFSDDVFAGFVTPNTGTVWRPCTVAGDVLTPYLTLPEAPADGALVRGTATYQWLDAALEGSSLQFAIPKKRADSKYEAYGCHASSLSIARVQPRQLAMLNWGFNSVDHTDDPAIVTSVITAATIPSKSPWIDSHATIYPYSASQVTYAAATQDRNLRALTLSIEGDLHPRLNPNHAQGVSMWDTGAAPALTLDLVVDIDDEWRDSMVAGSAYGILVSFGRTAGKVALFWVRKAIFLGFPDDAEDDAMLVNNLSFGFSADVDYNAATPLPAMLFGQG